MEEAPRHKNPTLPGGSYDLTEDNGCTISANNLVVIELPVYR